MARLKDIRDAGWVKSWVEFQSEDGTVFDKRLSIILKTTLKGNEPKAQGPSPTTESHVGENNNLP